MEIFGEAVYVWGQGLCASLEMNWQPGVQGAACLFSHVSWNQLILNNRIILLSFITSPYQRLRESTHPRSAVVHWLKTNDNMKGLGGFLHSFLNLLMFYKRTEQLTKMERMIVYERLNG